MRKQLAALLGAIVIAAAAQATPIVTFDGGTTALSLTPGTQATITIGITPDANLAAGFNLIFAVSDTSSISLVSCSPSAGVQQSCPAGGVNFSFGAALSTSASSPFAVASFTVNVSSGAANGATISLTAASTVTNDSLDDVFVGPATVAQVVALPEPMTASLLVAGLAGLTLLGRKRNA